MKEKTILCECCGKGTTHILIMEDIISEKICTKCGLWSDYKIKKDNNFNRFEEEF